MDIFVDVMMCIIEYMSNMLIITDKVVVNYIN